MKKTLVAVACAALTLLSIGFVYLPQLASEAARAGSLPALASSAEASATLYWYLARAVSTLVPAALAAGLGHRSARETAGPQTYRHLGLTAVAGCVVGVLVGGIGLMSVNAATDGLSILAVSALIVAIETSVLVVASVLAGAALGSDEPIRRSVTPESAGEATR